MRNLISAEWTKLLPHRATWLLVWIYPILFFVALTIGIIVAPSSSKQAMVASGWIEETAQIWYLSGFTLGRYFIAAYFALVFAGEYGWNTWKLVVPHAARWKLVGSKYLVALVLLYLAWTATAAISVILQFVKASVAGDAVPQGVTFGAILDGHFTLLLQGVAPLLLTAVYASTAAVLTRSTLAAFIIALVLATLDDVFGKIVRGLSSYGFEWLAVPYRVLPGYHLENFTSWLREGVGFQLKLASGTIVSYSQTLSLLALIAWIGGLAALTFFWFRRQDIN
jgi:ABC-2 type transport system permease protein